MSDYGGAISMSKSDNSQIDPAEKEFVKSIVGGVRGQKKYTGLAGDFIFDLVGDNEKLDLLLIIYYHGVVNEKKAEKYFQRAKEHDLPLIEEIAENLRQSLGGDFLVNPYFSKW